MFFPRGVQSHLSYLNSLVAPRNIVPLELCKFSFVYIINFHISKFPRIPWAIKYIHILSAKKSCSQVHSRLLKDALGSHTCDEEATVIRSCATTWRGQSLPGAPRCVNGRFHCFTVSCWGVSHLDIRCHISIHILNFYLYIYMISINGYLLTFTFPFQTGASHRKKYNNIASCCWSLDRLLTWRRFPGISYSHTDSPLKINNGLLGSQNLRPQKFRVLLSHIMFTSLWN